MRFYLLSVLLVPFLLVSSLRAQELTPVFENITEGLPSTEVHDMFQDSIGYMWFATDRGICRYNGDEMKIIDTDKDIPTNVFFKFFKQSETKVWLLTKNTTLYSFNPLEAKPKFRAHPKNLEIEKMIFSSKFKRSVSDLKFVENGMIMLFRKSPGYIVIPENDKCRWVKGQEDEYFSVTLNADIKIEVNNGIYYTQLVSHNQATPPTFITINNIKIDDLDLKNAFIHFDFGISSTIKNGKGTYITISNYLFRIHQNKITFIHLKESILSLTESRGKLYVGTFDGIIECNSDLTNSRYILKDVSVTYIYIDRDNVFWFSTLQNGVFKSATLQINELKLPSSFSSSYLMEQGRYLQLFDQVKEKTLFYDRNFHQSAYFSNVDRVDKRISFDDSEIFKYLDTPTLFKLSFLGKRNTIRKNIVYSGATNPVEYYIGNSSVLKLSNNSAEFFFSPSDGSQLTFAKPIDESTLLLGTNKGLSILNHDGTNLRKIKGSERIHFYSVERVFDQLVLTSNEGIHIFKNHQLHTLFPIASNKLVSLYKEDDNLIWAWGDHEVYQLKFGKNGSNPQKVKFFSLSNGDVINSLVVFNNQLCISTKKRVLIIDKDDYFLKKNTSSFTFIIDSIMIDGLSLNNLSSVSIYDVKKLSLFFNTICYDNELSKNLEYTIDGETWLETNKNSIVISNLSSGEYLLQIRRIDDPSKILFILPIHVSKVWYQSNWFIGLCSMLIMIFVAFMIFLFFKSRDKKRSAELDKLNLELKLLTSKMNPHFTFNTINSIQYYILKSDKKEAIQYLSDFALLIRKSLDFSMAERITIEDEIHFLSLYVKMENKRFDSNFRLKFDLVPPNIVQSKKIPSMLIQPLVENIILHAGYSEDEDKLINIKIVYSHSFFTLEVIDHGKGIQAKDDFNKHKSYGIDILKSRVKIYNGAEFRNSDVNIQSTSVGTTVTIRLKEWE